MSKNAFLEKYAKKQQNDDLDVYKKYLTNKEALLKANYIVLRECVRAIGATILINGNCAFSTESNKIVDIFTDTFSVYQTHSQQSSELCYYADDNILSSYPSEIHFIKSQREFTNIIYNLLLDFVDISDKTEINLSILTMPFDNGTLEETARELNSYLLAVENQKEKYKYLEEDDNRSIYDFICYIIGSSFLMNIDQIHTLRDDINTTLVDKELINCFYSLFPMFDNINNSSNYLPILDYILENTIKFINTNLNLEIDISLEQFIQMEPEEFQSLRDLWKESIADKEYNFYSSDEDTFEYVSPDGVTQEEYNHFSYAVENNNVSEPQPDSKSSAAILKFFESNSNALVAKLKDSGLQLSAAALQNDQNITRVANVVYNLLPGMVRIFVSFDTVENFLLEHRQWLINKLI